MPKEIIAPYKSEDKVEACKYTKDEQEYRTYIINRATLARDRREAPYIELDDMSYTQYYETNFKTGNSYLRPKKNKEDTRIVTGTTLEKENTFLSAILNYNFVPRVEAYDKNDLPLVGLGDKLDSLIKKSRLIENYESKRALIYKEGVDQGTAFVEEVWVEEDEIAKTVNGMDYSTGRVDIGKIKIDKKRKRKVIGCRSNLLPGTGVYLGDIKQFFMDKQPYVITRDVITYEEADACYGGYDRFKYVPKTLILSDLENTTTERDWTLEDLQEGFVEVIKYRDKWANEYMLMLNGVMMLPVGFPLTEISPSGEYNLAKLDIEPISEFFAYSKSYPAKTKVDQEILDDTIRTFVLKLRQMLEPPFINNTNQVLSRKIFYPGTFTQNVNPNQLVKLLGENNGINTGEFQVFQLIKQIVDEKTSNPILSGVASSGEQTATEVMELKKQSMMKLGYAIYGIMDFEKRMAWLRLYNILANWTKPIDKAIDEIKKTLVDTYRSISVNEEDEFGSFTRIMEFNPEGVTKSPEQIDAEAQILSTPERPVQKVYLNPNALRERMMEFKFYIDVNPTEKDTSELRAMLFTKRVAEAKQLFGPQSTNDPYIKQRMAILAKEDPDKFWAKQQPMMPVNPMIKPGNTMGGQASQQLGEALGVSGPPPMQSIIE
jgi:hypothetical protein